MKERQRDSDRHLGVKKSISRIKSEFGESKTKKKTKKVEVLISHRNSNLSKVRHF